MTQIKPILFYSILYRGRSSGRRGRRELETERVRIVREVNTRAKHVYTDEGVEQRGGGGSDGLVM